MTDPTMSEEELREIEEHLKEDALVLRLAAAVRVERRALRRERDRASELETRALAAESERDALKAIAIKSDEELSECAELATSGASWHEALTPSGHVGKLLAERDGLRQELEQARGRALPEDARERIARALFEDDAERKSGRGPFPGPWETQSVLHQDDYRVKADAVLAALVKP